MLFIQSISVSFGAFLRPWSLPSFIHHALSLLPSIVHTRLFSIVLSFSRGDHALGCSPIHRLDLLSSVLPLLHSFPPSSSVILFAFDRSRPWCSGEAVAPGVVDAREAVLSSALYYPPPRPPGILLSSFRPSLSSLCPSVSASVAQFICLQGQSPLDAFILRSLVQFLLSSVHLSLVAVFFPTKTQSSVVRLHYTSSGVFREVDMEQCPPPSGRRLIFSSWNNLYRESIGLVEFKGMLDTLSITATETLNSIQGIF